ncbi:UrcA family protein [Sphingomonas sp.]|uniref:UrcA family protein n=1 Tax=Sphingomonas sp. TaxID=28214 RepID=UPI001B17B048|nr:UrcA family protein [Sphingomonas sp.]MBO9712334.1 UrcA family protein [Sphingomonas sp.]
MTKMIASLAAVTALLTAAPALATNPTAASVTIQTADLDLARPGDAARLERRIATATESVCGSYASARDGEDLQIKACRAQVASQIAPQVAALRARTQLANR